MRALLLRVSLLATGFFVGANASASKLDTFLSNHCFECHDDEIKKGELNLLDLELRLDSEKQLHVWTYVHDRIASGEMPPKKKPRPDAAESAAALEELGAKLLAADRERREVVQRRLNRVEYENTLHDLLHIDTELRDTLPEDSIKDGFDNIGAALAISTEQMQAYLAAAQLALDAALADPGEKRPETKAITKWLGRDGGKSVDGKFKSGQFRKLEDDFVAVYTGAGYIPTSVIAAPEDGWYDMELTCRTHLTDGEPVTVVILQDNGRLRTTSTLGFYQAGPENTVIRQRIKLNQGDKLKPLPFNFPYVKPDPEYDGPGLAIGPITLTGPLTATWPPKGHATLLGDVDPAKAGAEEARTILKNFLPRAFRRPVADAEVDPYLGLVTSRLEEGRPFLSALKVGLQAALCSPDFLFLAEPGENQTIPGTISDIQLASRLSYFLWSSMPDAPLLSLANRGKLSDPETLREEVERMLADPRARRFTENFTGQWLKLREIDFTTPDKNLYPEFDAHLQNSMIEESHAFFDEVLSKDLPVQNFVDSDFAMLNERLARHYGVPNVSSFAIQRVRLSQDSPRGGVLTQGSVLKVTANGTNTSPVLRGIWVLDNILGAPSPPPPAGVPAVEPDIRGATTIREQLDLHRNSEKCQSCHRKIDPPGFALELFDPIGGYRDHYRSMGAGENVAALINGRNVRYKKGPAVDSSGVTPDGHEFKGIRDFKARLLEDETIITRCLTEKLLTYGLGRSLGFSDRPEIERIVTEVSAKGQGLRTLIHEIVQSGTFRAP